MKARNPISGNLETVYVKALDSMPVGTQVEYTGSTIPVGWEEVNDYSTTEIDTGIIWKDNSHIYRKIITGLSLSPKPAGITYTNASFSDIKDIIDVKMTRAKTGSVNPAVAVCSGTLSGTTLSIYAITEFSNCDTLILEYTKTTD